MASLGILPGGPGGGEKAAPLAPLGIGLIERYDRGTERPLLHWTKLRDSPGRALNADHAQLFRLVDQLALKVFLLQHRPDV